MTSAYGAASGSTTHRRTISPTGTRNPSSSSSQQPVIHPDIDPAPTHKRFPDTRGLAPRLPRLPSATSSRHPRPSPCRPSPTMGPNSIPSFRSQCFES